jgi:hypothetical protein
VLGPGVTHWLTIDAAGQMLTSLPAPDAVSTFSHELLVLPAGWIAWDTYVEDRRYLLAWSHRDQIMRRELPKGLAFTSVAVDTRGEFVAVSASSGLNIGSQRDEVWLVRTSDGTELFRRYAPKYSRDTVALPGGRFFAAGEVIDSRPAVRIHRLPVRATQRQGPSPDRSSSPAVRAGSWRAG